MRRRGGVSESPTRQLEETPTLSPSEQPQQQIAEQPLIRPEFYCPAWPSCNATFTDSEAQRQHIRRHAHAQGI